jgi:hypothetical protein
VISSSKAETKAARLAGLIFAWTESLRIYLLVSQRELARFMDSRSQL